MSGNGEVCEKEVKLKIEYEIVPKDASSEEALLKIKALLCCECDDDDDDSIITP